MKSSSTTTACMRASPPARWPTLEGGKRGARGHRLETLRGSLSLRDMTSRRTIAAMASSAIFLTGQNQIRPCGGDVNPRPRYSSKSPLRGPTINLTLNRSAIGGARSLSLRALRRSDHRIRGRTYCFGATIEVSIWEIPNKPTVSGGAIVQKDRTASSSAVAHAAARGIASRAMALSIFSSE